MMYEKRKTHSDETAVVLADLVIEKRVGMMCGLERITGSCRKYDTDPCCWRSLQ